MIVSKIPILLICAAVFVLSLTGTVYADANDTKALYLYRVATYVQSWPRQADLTFCVLGANSFGNKLSALLDRNKIRKYRLLKKNISSASQAGNCNVLFVRGDGNIAQVLKHRNAGTLTVSDAPGFAKRGGMIRFVQVGGRIGFYVNRKSLQKAGIRMSSRFLSQVDKTYD